MNNTIRLWDVHSGKELRTLSGDCSWVNSIALTADGKPLASGGHDYSIKLWDVASGKELHTLEGPR